MNNLNDNIVQIDSRKQYMEDMQRYTLYTLINRYIPDIRDGLKPVQKRILTAMYFDLHCTPARTIKSAKITGAVIGKYHPHGSCLSADTLVYMMDNKIFTLGDLYNNGILEFDTIGINPNTLKPEPVHVHDLRIGQMTDKIYHIFLSDGSELKVTGNHPIMKHDGSYVRADQLNNGDRLMNKSLKEKENERLFIGRVPLHEIVCDYYNGPLKPGYERHHIDHNKKNNSKENLMQLTSSDHAKEHCHDQSSIEGLSLGRQEMFGDGVFSRQLTKNKNSLLISLYNKYLGIRRFKHAIGLLKEKGLEITEENYELLRPSYYNLPIIERLINKGYGNSFNDLVNLEVPTVGELYSENKSKYVKMCYLVRKPNMEGFKRNNIFNYIDNMVDNHDISYGNFLTYGNAYNISEQEYYAYYNMYLSYRPFVVNVLVEDVHQIPMYDFTVDTTNNMCIVASESYHKDSMTLLCVHNSSVYGTMKPMINWFENPIPILGKQGNFGNFQGAPAAAERYTETTLSKFGIECVLGDLVESKQVVDWSPTFDNQDLEPECMAVKIPLLLLNGTFSIAVGTKVEIPHHSLNDIIDAVLTLMHNPNAKIALIPDPCMPCEIVDTNWQSISDKGFGYYTVRGIVKTMHNDKTGRDILSIQSVPDLVFGDSIKNKVEDLIKDSKLIQVDDIQDHSNEDQLDLRIILKHGADPEYVKQVLYKHTSLQDTKRINMEVLNDLDVSRISYKAYLLYFLEFRRGIKFRLYNFKLQKTETRLHQIEAYIKILESGDVENIIHMIRNQNSMEEGYLVNWLMKKLSITDLQAKFILHTEIQRLSKGHLNKYKEEQKTLLNDVNYYINMITHEDLIDKEIENELIDIRAKYGKPRKSILIKENEANDIPGGEFKIIITEANYIKKMQVNDPIKSFKGDNPKCIIIADNTKDLLLFDEMGKVFKLPVYKIMFTEKNSPGIDIRLLVKNLTSNIRTIMYQPIVETLANKKSKYFIVSVTVNGMIKRMDLNDIINATPSGIIYSKLNKGDSVKDIIIANHKSDIVIYTKSKALRMPIESVPYLKRSTIGNKAMNTSEGVDGVSIITNDTTDIIVVTAKGKFNRFNVSALPVKDRGKAPNNVIKLTRGDSIVNIFSCNSHNRIRVVRAEGIEELDIKDIPVGSSISAGTKIGKEGIIKCELIRV